MADKTFVVTHAHARYPLTVTGKTLKEALDNEGLDPSIWREVTPPQSEGDTASGENQGDAGPQDN